MGIQEEPLHSGEFIFPCQDLAIHFSQLFFAKRSEFIREGIQHPTIHIHIGVHSEMNYFQPCLFKNSFPFRGEHSVLIKLSG